MTFYSQQCCIAIKSRVNGIYYVDAFDGATHRLPHKRTYVYVWSHLSALSKADVKMSRNVPYL